MRRSLPGVVGTFVALGLVATAGVVSAPLANAVDVTENGFTYEIVEGGAFISDYDPSASGALGVANLVIPSTLGGVATTQIDGYAFDSAGLTGSLTIPNSVAGIGDYAFTGNTGLTSVSFGTSQTASALSSIGEASFASTGLTGPLVFPNSLVTIDDVAFGNLTGVTAVAFGSSQALSQLTSIGDSAFVNTGITGALSLPDSLTSLGPSAFGTNALMTSVVFGSSQTAAQLATVGDGAFAGTALAGPLVLPNSLTSIGDSAFAFLPALTSISFESAPGLSQLATIGDTVFFRDSGLSGALSIPNSVTSVGGSAFQQAGPMTLSLGTSMTASHLTTIGLSAFDFAAANTSLAIPDSVTGMGDAAFFSFSSLSQLTIGAGVTSIPANAFGYAPLTSITFAGNAPSGVGTSAFASSYTPTFTRWQGSTGWGSTYNATGQDFNVAIAPPSVASVSPVRGGVSGNQLVTITGTGFATGASVTMGTPATDVTVVNARTITARTPVAAGGGPVGVTVANIAVDPPLGTGERLSGSLSSGYEFLTPGPLAYSSGTFPTVTVGSASTLTVTATNSGGDTLTPSLIRATGAAVTITGGTCQVATPISAGASCTIRLSWTPVAAGTITGSELTIAYPSGDAPNNSLTLAGTATAPQEGGGGGSSSAAATTTVVPAPAPASSPSVQPVPTELKPGTGSLLINGVPTPVVVEATSDGRELIVTGAGVRLVLSATGANGRPVPLAADGSLVVSSVGGVPMAGSGFAAGSTVTLFMFSTPVTLGMVTAGADGSYATKALIPAATVPGSHTIQVVGTTANGQSVALSMGVTVKAPSSAGAGMSVHVARSRTHFTGKNFVVEARGAQARCLVKFTIQGSTATAKSGALGKARVMLAAPSRKGTWVVAARVSGAGCQTVSARTRIHVVAP